LKKYAFCQPIEAELRLFEEEFRSVLASDVSLINDIAMHLAAHRGKRLRPILVFLTCGLHGAPPSVALKPALAIELLHTATLVHDDVVDSSFLRRGAPTVNGLWSNRISILMGDLLFARALALLVDGGDLRALRLLSDATFRMSRGELIQEEHGSDYQLMERTYFRVVSDKTAALISVCCQLGALFAGADDAKLSTMERFGENMGIAFQIRDDILDYVGDEGTLGKPIGSDILNNKITLPLLHALRNADPETAQEMLAHLQSGEEGRVGAVVEFVRQKDGVKYAEEQVERHLRAALACLDGYESSPYLVALRELARYVGTRQE